MVVDVNVTCRPDLKELGLFTHIISRARRDARTSDESSDFDATKDFAEECHTLLQSLIQQAFESGREYERKAP